MTTQATEVLATLAVQQYDQLYELMSVQLGLQAVLLGAMLAGFAVLIWAVTRK